MKTGENLTKPALSSLADIGLALRQRRLEKNVSLQVIAQELRLTVRQVTALESGDFSGFRGAVFIKGYLRACARFYGMDGDALVRAYEQLEPQQETRFFAVATGVNRVVIAPSRHQGKKLLLLVVIGLVFAVCFWQWKVHGVPSLPWPVLQTPEILPASPVVDDQTVANVPPQSSLSAQDVAAVPIQQAVADESAAPVSAAPAPANTAVDTQAEVQGSALHIEFSDDCWVQIKDSEGKVLHEKTHRKGEVFDMTAQAPLHIWVGRALAVNVSYNGTLVAVPAKPGFQSVQFILGDDVRSGDSE